MYRNDASVLVWGGIVGNHVVGPHFFDENLNRDVYDHFLTHHLDGYLQGIPEQTRRCIMFMHIGAPGHRVNLNIQFPNNRFPKGWIGL